MGSHLYDALISLFIFPGRVRSGKYSRRYLINYLLSWIRSPSILSVVVITLEFAWNPR